MEFIYKDIKINYETKGEGQPILFIHGLACDMNLMKGCMEPLFRRRNLENKKPYKRVYIDLPGMGKSTANMGWASSDKVLEVILAFIKEKIKGKFLLCGESYGGYLSRAVLAKKSEDIEGLMLICPVAVPERKKRDLPQEKVVFDQEEPERFKDYNLNELKEEEKNFRDDLHMYGVLLNSEILERFKNEVEVGLAIGNKEYISQLYKNYTISFDVDGELWQIKYSKPTLILCGRQDICVGYKDHLKLIESYPRSTFGLVDMAGHNLQIEQKEIFDSLMDNWLERIEYDRKYE